MSRHKYNSADRFDNRPLVAPSTEVTAWIATDKKARTFRLGNKASLEEVTGAVDPASQRWRWRICKFGGETGIASSREAAARQAEFCLGMGEMPIVLPDTPAAKGARKGGAA